MIEVAESLLVKFGAGADSSALVKLELDDVLNNGKTSFAPGDTINVRLHHDATVQLEKIVSTDFMMAAQGDGPRTIEESNAWLVSNDEHQLGYNPSTSLLYKYFGKKASGLKRSGRQVTISGGDLPSQCLISYAASFSFFKLITTKFELAADESYPITIVAYMEASE